MRDASSVDPERLDSYSVEDLARACAQRSSRSRAPAARGPDPCYELFRRALAHPPDDDAWQSILVQYHRQIRFWLGQYAADDTVQEVFLRFWKAQQTTTFSFASRFPGISAVMGYLKRCALTVRFEAWQEEEQRRLLWDRLHDAALVESILEFTRPGCGHEAFDCRQLVLSRLTDEREQVVFELTYRYDLTPREIQAERPDLFPDVRTVHRAKENLLKRLKRDPELRTWWADRRHRDDGGGNSTGSPV
jgi:DNA-directed RNA polymerase specialized sigma24 family protein